VLTKSAEEPILDAHFQKLRVFQNTYDAGTGHPDGKTVGVQP
jgi:hypothetical protein